MKMMGAEIANLHLADVIHGDLTTSNMMLQRPSASATGTATLVRAMSFESDNRSLRLN